MCSPKTKTKTKTTAHDAPASIYRPSALFAFGHDAEHCVRPYITRLPGRSCDGTGSRRGTTKVPGRQLPRAEKLRLWPLPRDGFVTRAGAGHVSLLRRDLQRVITFRANFPLLFRTSVTLRILMVFCLF